MPTIYTYRYSAQKSIHKAAWPGEGHPGFVDDFMVEFSTKGAPELLSQTLRIHQLEESRSNFTRRIQADFAHDFTRNSACAMNRRQAMIHIKFLVLLKLEQIT
jgi:hypothetical protein